METNAADKETEANAAQDNKAAMEDGFVRSLATIHKSLKNSKNLK